MEHCLICAGKAKNTSDNMMTDRRISQMTQMDKIVDYIYSIPKFTKKGGMIQTAQIMALFEHPGE